MYGGALSTVPPGVDGPAALEELRKRVEGPDGPRPGSAEDKWSYSRSDPMLVRFLIARQWKVEKAAEMLREHYHWMEDRGVEALLTDPWPEEHHIKKYYPMAYHGTDKLGRPIYIERPGLIDMPRLLQATTPERVIDYFSYGCELQVRQRLPACSLMRGEVIDKSFNICDLEGLSFGIVTHTTARRVLKDVIMQSQKHYPECMGSLVIINAPRVFSLAWSFVKPLLDEKTVSKISIFDSSKEAFTKELLKHVDADQLPQIFGGKCVCDGHDQLSCMTSMKGPWTNPEVLRLIKTEPLERIMSPAGCRLLHTGRLGSTPGTSEPATPVATVADGSEHEESPRAAAASTANRCPSAAPLQEQLVAFDHLSQHDSGDSQGSQRMLASSLSYSDLREPSWAPNTEMEKAKWAVAELQEEYRQLMDGHMTTLTDWVEQYNTLVEDIGRQIIERAQAYYDTRSLWQQAIEEYVRSQDLSERVASDLEEAVQRLARVELAFMDATLLLVEDEEDMGVFASSVEDPVVRGEPRLLKALWISHLGDLVTRLQWRRDVLRMELVKSNQELNTAKNKFEDEEAKHRSCTWNCSVRRAEPFFEKRRQHMQLVDGQLQQLQQLEQQVRAAKDAVAAVQDAERPWTREDLSAEGVGLKTFEIAGAEPGEDEFEFHSCSENSSDNE